MEDLIRRTHELLALTNSLSKENRMNKAIRIVLVDEHELVRQGLRGMLELEEDMKIVGDYASAEEALTEMARFRNDIVLMGTQMPGMNMIEATRNLKRSGLNYGGDVIILAESMAYQAEALEVGAASYLLKDVTRAELTQAIRGVYQDRHPLKEYDSFVDEVVELVIPSSANAAWLLRFMCQVEEILHDDFTSFASIICTVGSWDRGTVITIRMRPNTSSSLLIKLANLPEVEKVEEELLARSAFSSSPKKFGLLSKPSISPSKRICVTLQETAMAGENRHR